jgi:hypothetical protein
MSESEQAASASQASPDAQPVPAKLPPDMTPSKPGAVPPSHADPGIIHTIIKEAPRQPNWVERVDE